MMNTEQLVNDWFEKWNTGDYMNLPVTADFQHTSPFGTIKGRDAYLELVKQNEDKFLGYRFQIHDQICSEHSGCVRYTATQGEDFKLDVSEWYYIKDGLIKEIIAYYHIGEIREERELE